MTKTLKYTKSINFLMHYSLLCPHKKLFSKFIQNKCNKLFNAKFSNISQTDFDKIYYKFNIILLRHQLKL